MHCSQDIHVTQLPFSTTDLQAFLLYLLTYKSFDAPNFIHMALKYTCDVNFCSCKLFQNYKCPVNCTFCYECTVISEF